MNVVAILCSDIHLSETAPIARSIEPNWLEAQRRPLNEVSGLAKDYDCPIVVAGDIFHRCNSGPALINWAIENMPVVYAIPGQHDLPMHNYEDIKRSAYWTLVEAGKIKHIDTVLKLNDGLYLHGFPWGKQFECFPNRGNSKAIHLAVVHKYLWIDGKGYVGASESDKLGFFRDSLRGYDAAVFGDNHNGFLTTANGVAVLNSGCLIRRNSNEASYRPTVGLLYEDGSMGKHRLDTSKDVWVGGDSVVTSPNNDNVDMDKFLTELDSLGGSDLLDFRAGLGMYVDNPDNGVSASVKGIINEVLEGV